jgi:hypothetical protein
MLTEKWFTMSLPYVAGSGRNLLRLLTMILHVSWLSGCTIRYKKSEMYNHFDTDFNIVNSSGLVCNGKLHRYSEACQGVNLTDHIMHFILPSVVDGIFEDIEMCIFVQ